MKKYNNLLVNSKKLALLVLLAASLSACGHAKEKPETESAIQDTAVQDSAKTQEQDNKRKLLWFIPLILVGSVGGLAFTSDAKSNHR